MTTTIAAPIAAPPFLRLTVLPDPPQIPDMASQMPDLARAVLILEDYYRSRPDAVVMGNCYLCRDAAAFRGSPYPDCMVSFNMPLPPAEINAANGYTISELGKPPDFVLEIASQSTGRRDYTAKREIYADYGVPEYWRFDHTGGQFHNAALAGDRLTPGGVYAAIPIAALPNGNFGGYSRALGLELRWDAGRLRFWNPSTGEYLPDLSEARAQRDAVADQRDAALAQRDAEIAARQVIAAQRDAEIAARQTIAARLDAEAAARQSAIAQRDAEAAARRAAEERIRQLEAQLSRQQHEN